MTKSETPIDDPRVRAWSEVRDPLERQLEPLGRAAIVPLHLRAGERVLDIGCGIAPTPIALAGAVGRSGEVVGIDVLQASIDVARADPNCPTNVTFVCGDVEAFAFAPAVFDAAFSRFGVMFFADPVAAFANVRRALRPGGRISFTCWRGLGENELDEFPLRAASAHLPAKFVAEAASSGHFSLSNADVIQQVLTKAGFMGVTVRPHDEDVRSGDLRAMVDVCSRFGALGKILREYPELRREAVPALERALRPLDGPGGPALRAATWVVLARAPG